MNRPENPIMPSVQLLVIFFTTLSFVVSAVQVDAAVTTDLAMRIVAPNTPNQRIDFVIRSDSDLDPKDITGINFNLVLGDGLGPLDEPSFVGDVVFTDGPGGIDYVWDRFPGEGGTTDTPSQFLIADYTFTSTSHALRPNGVLASVFIDTTGFTTGEFALSLSGDSSIGLLPTNLIRTGGADFVPEFPASADSIIRIAIIPEPGTMSALTVVAITLAIAQRRRRRRSRLIPGSGLVV